MAIVTQTFYISTGAKNAMHTLRIRRTCTGVNPAFLPDFYVRNLAVDVETAQAKAQEYFDAWIERVGCNRPDFIVRLDLEPEYDITKRRGKLSAKDTRALEAIESGFFPFGKHRGEAIANAPDSYVLFFADKVNNEESNVVFAALAAACMGVAFEKGLIAKREAARKERAIIDAKSVFVGEIGERREFSGIVISSFVKRNDYDGSEFWINKIRCGDDIITYIGNKMGERDQSINFKATIKAHSEYNGVKSTLVNRPKMA